MISTDKLEEVISKEKNLDQILKDVPDIKFIDYLNSLMNQKEISKSDLISQANIVRTYGYQIIDGRKKPSKNKVLSLSFALGCNLHDTNNLLSLSDNGQLYPKVKRDAIIIYAIINNLSLQETNIALDEHQQEIID